MKRVWAPGYALLGTLQCLALGAVVSAGISAGGWSNIGLVWPGFAGLGVLALLAVRVWRVGVRASGEEAIHDMLCRRRRYRLDTIVDVGTGNYSGWYNRWSDSLAFDMVILLVRQSDIDVEVDVPELGGRPRKVAERAQAVRDLLEASVRRSE